MEFINLFTFSVNRSVKDSFLQILQNLFHLEKHPVAVFCKHRIHKLIRLGADGKYEEALETQSTNG
ncbi:hypothetical protein RhiirA4_488187 [Rhizophagus irregularis]|uniref:Uncharacterized protein n=1 Tax=Rhizophagus irregularis TaxID=588596 RepID=A0A2I1HTH9_9GLOM|nr:hypothetical protein RhiirA4_488187 [Rhizophagus irregularis]